VAVFSAASPRSVTRYPDRVPPGSHELAAVREPVVVLTWPWHERDTQSPVERLGVPVFTPAPDTADDLVLKFGITTEEAAGGSPDLAWLLARHVGEAPICTRRETGCRSGSRPSSGGSTTTSCSGSSVGMR
jgi:hypothetical protein